MAQPTWLNKTLFPFNSKWITIDGHSLHYIDEGHGDVILFVHGTPEWCFGFRDLIKDLRKDFRCIAVDHLGFGLSDKPQNGNFSVEAHIKRLTKFINQLDLKNVSIVANDFGGGISMGYALFNVSNIKSVILFNTWMWSLREDPHFSKPAKAIDSWFGRFLYKRLNFPVNYLLPSAYGDISKMSKEVHDHYKKVVPDPASRMALHAIAVELMNASPLWESMWKRVSDIEHKPFMIIWGTRDKFVPASAFDKWKQRLPKAKTVIFETAGHFVQEEKPVEMAAEIRDFLKA